MSGIYQVISETVPKMGGWCSVSKAHALAQLVLENKPEIVVELGVWCGRSLVPMALACKENGRGVVMGVDSWSPIESVKGQNSEHTAWWSKTNHEAALKECVDKIRELKLEKFTNLFRVKTDDFESPKNIGLLHVDGNHGEQAIKDTIRFAPKVIKGGFIVMDDLNWTDGGVEKSIMILMGLGFTWHSKVKNDVDDYAILKKTY